MGRVFFLGAGFSKHAGFPLGGELLSFVRQELNNSKDYFDQSCYSPILERVIELYKSSNLSHFASNFELLLTSLSLLLAYNDKDFIDKLRPIYDEFVGSYDSKRYFLPELILGRITYGIRNAFLNHHMKICDYWDSPFICDEIIAGAYSRFFDILEAGDVIITLNYDVLCEQGLWNKRKWTFLDGYGFKKEKEDLMDKDKVHLYTQAEESQIKVLKLHGSVNWAGDYDKDGIILNDLQRYFHGYSGNDYERATGDQTITLVLPSYLTSYIKRKFILEIWRQARECIINCDQLYFIGYSLSDIDSALQYMLYDAISSNQKLNKGDIYVIDNQSSDGTFEFFYKKDISMKFNKFLNGKYTFINKAFEDWIMDK